ncbi:hypothetical protein [Spiroplasma alleghenense]|uniref:Uncharacterized protein n=1 Tax=Spiroplasma alleghenense TaxID=216931 RepID=A0A345Z555_9MOLU|nr:hypothetical protein [Spiroplasma alleghenense]AXK51734.1 hypothetical protein SALLE_v1c10640 [Spiroplasma alleghenense]
MLETKKIIILMNKEDIKINFVISEDSNAPTEINKFVNSSNFSQMDKKRYNKELHKSLKGYEIPVSKCSAEIEQALLKIINQHKKDREQDRNEINQYKKDREQDRNEIMKLKKILTKNFFLKDSNEDETH